jgi:hypothetical protein
MIVAAKDFLLTILGHEVLFSRKFSQKLFATGYWIMILAKGLWPNIF